MQILGVLLTPDPGDTPQTMLPGSFRSASSGEWSGTTGRVRQLLLIYRGALCLDEVYRADSVDPESWIVLSETASKCSKGVTAVNVLRTKPLKKTKPKGLTTQADFDLSSLSRLLPLSSESRATIPTSLTPMPASCSHPTARSFPTQPLNRNPLRSLPAGHRSFLLYVQDTPNHDDHSASLGSVSDHYVSMLLLLWHGGGRVVSGGLRSCRQGFNRVHCVYRCSRRSGRAAENLAVSFHRTLPVVIKLLVSNAEMTGVAVKQQVG